jgi:hypothetical protein
MVKPKTDGGPPLESCKRRLSPKHFRRWKHWAATSEWEPAMFATWSCRGVLRRVRAMRVGWAIRASRRWRFMMRVCGRGRFIFCPSCAAKQREVSTRHETDESNNNKRTGSCNDFAPGRGTCPFNPNCLRLIVIWNRQRRAGQCWRVVSHDLT